MNFVSEFFPGSVVAAATKEFDALDRGIIEMGQSGMHYNMDSTVIRHRVIRTISSRIHIENKFTDEYNRD